MRCCLAGVVGVARAVGLLADADSAEMGRLVGEAEEKRREDAGHLVFAELPGRLLPALVLAEDERQAATVDQPILRRHRDGARPSAAGAHVHGEIELPVQRPPPPLLGSGRLLPWKMVREARSVRLTRSCSRFGEPTEPSSWWGVLREHNKADHVAHAAHDRAVRLGVVGEVHLRELVHLARAVGAHGAGYLFYIALSCLSVPGLSGGLRGLTDGR